MFFDFIFFKAVAGMGRFTGPSAVFLIPF